MNDNTDSPSDSKSSSKAPIVRGARACTTCRQAKMKCVGAEDGLKPCQRCKRSNVECVFEKHRRGRKPGSKLSEASKMLRRLEKGLNTAKLKSQATESAEPRGSTHDAHYSSMQPLENVWGSSQFQGEGSSTYPIDDYGRTGPGSRPMDVEEEQDPDQPEESIRPVPAEMIKCETRRNSFFKTILNPEESAPARGSLQRLSPPSSQSKSTPELSGVQDPITAGIINEDDAKVFFDILYLRLNPFINLFDPSLHTVTYVRTKCPFLFTTIIMAGCKFFKPEAFKPCQKLAQELAVKAFAEAWKRVEVVQAFACLTYWSIPDDNRTWTYIGYACRMAVELGLNRFVPNPPANETELQKLERRNRERTYLVLFVHDRSLSTQTGKHWMLPEDDLVRHSATWHKEGDAAIRHEDIIVAAFVALRRVTVADVHASTQCMSPGGTRQVDYARLKNCNLELEEWTERWTNEMNRAGGQRFHTSLLLFFSLHVKLYLNSFAVQAIIKAPASATGEDIESLRICFRSARESLRIVSEDFASMGMLRYGQDSVLVMSAYSAIMLLKLPRASAATPFLQISTDDVYSLVRQTADAYKHTCATSSEIISTVTHARFLENLVTTDIASTRTDRERYGNHSIPLDPRLMSSSTSQGAAQGHSNHVQPSHPVQEAPVSFSASVNPPSHSQTYSQDYLPSPRGPHGPSSPQTSAAYQYQGYSNNYQPTMSEQDAHYHRLMFSETNLGVSGYGMGSSSPQQVERYGGETSYSQPAYGHAYNQPMHYTPAPASVPNNFNY